MADTPFTKVTKVRIHPSAHIGEGSTFWGSVVIGKKVFVADHCVIGLPAPEEVSDIYSSKGQLTSIGPNVRIGSNVIIHNGARIDAGVLIDDGCVIGPESTIRSRTRILYGARVYWRVCIGRECIIGGFCCDRSVINDKALMMGNLIHKMLDPNAPWDSTEEPSPVVGKGAFVGMGSFVIGGVKIGASSYIAAGAIVTKDVRAKHIVVGTRQFTRAAWERGKRTAKSR